MSAPDSGQPGYGGGSTPEEGGGTWTPRNGLGTAALVLGILALVFCWTGVVGVVLGLLAVILGIMAVRRVQRREATNQGSSIAGIVTGGLGLLVGILFLVTVGVFFSMFGRQTHDFQSCLQQAKGDQAKVQQCFQQYQRQLPGNGG